MRANQMLAACGIHFTVEILACQYGAAHSRSTQILQSSRRPNPEVYDAEEWGDRRYMPFDWDEKTKATSNLNSALN